MAHFDGDPAEAEADLARATQTAFAAEAALAAAEERVEAIMALDRSDVRGGEKQISQMMAAAESHIEVLRDAVTEAEDDLSRTQDHWMDVRYLHD